MIKLSSKTHGRRLAAIRKNRGWTQAKLGAAIGKTRDTIWAWENNRCDIRVADAERCAFVLGCWLHDLLAPVEEPIPPRPPLWPWVRRHPVSSA